jgi:hypothetical protein
MGVNGICFYQRLTIVLRLLSKRMTGPENEDPRHYRFVIDCKIVDEWTRNTLFPKVKFLYADGDLAIGGSIYNFYKNTCINRTGEGLSGVGGDNSERTKYQTELWEHCSNKGIRKTLSMKRSAVTNQMGVKFMGK